MENEIVLDTFRRQLESYCTSSGTLKELFEQRIRGFVLALEVSNQKNEANKCKDFFTKRTGQILDLR